MHSLLQSISRIVPQKSVLALVSAGALLLSAATTLASSTALIFDSQPGDYIGGGQSYYYTPADGSFSAQGTGEFSLSFANGAHNWTVEFAGPDHAPLAVGTYSGATRYPFQGPGEPGLTIYGDGRGCNQSAGSFTVHEIVYDTGNVIVSFHASFEQHCEAGNPALVGEVFYNSADTLPPRFHFTSPSSATTTQGRPFSYQSRTSQTTSSYSATGLPPGLSINASTGLISGTATANGLFSVTINATRPGDTAALTLSLLVTPPNESAGPYTALSMQSDPGDYIGAGRSYLYRPQDGSFSSYSTAQYIRITFETPNFNHNWSINLSPPFGQSLHVGTYNNARRSASVTNPGMDVYGDGRGCNDTVGSFTIKEIGFSSNGKLERLRATFVQHCEGGGPALYGIIWYSLSNSRSFPITTLPVTALPICSLG